MSVAYQYAVLRYVPAVEREEFINVGVLVYAPRSAFLDLAHEVSPQRLQGFSSTAQVSEVVSQLETMRHMCRGEAVVGASALERPSQKFGWLVAPRSTVLQPGPVHGGTCADPSAELQRLLGRLVA